MDRETIRQGLAGVACIVLAALFLQGDKLVLAYTTVSGFGFTLIGALFKGPNQLTRSQAERMAEDRVAQALGDSKPPAR